MLFRTVIKYAIAQGCVEDSAMITCYFEGFLKFADAQKPECGWMARKLTCMSRTVLIPNPNNRWFVIT